MLQSQSGSPPVQRGQQLMTNFYQIQFDPTVQLARYLLYLEPAVSTELEEVNRKSIFMEAKSGLNANLKAFVQHNYSNIYSHTLLQPNTPIMLGKIESNSQNIVQNMYKLRELLMIQISSEPEYTQLIGRFFKQLLRKQHLTQIGRKYFNPKESVRFDQFSLQVLPGLSCNLARFEDLKTYYVNVDCSFKVLRTQTVYDELRQTRNGSALEGATVMTSYNNKFYRINRIDFNIKPSQTFKKEDGSEMSYIDYYRQRYNVNIKDQNQPMIEVIDKSRKNQVQKILNLVPELCVMTGLTNEMRNVKDNYIDLSDKNFQTMKQIATVTKPKGIDRVRQADKFIQCFYDKESQKIMKDWRIQLNRQCVQIESHKLKAGDVVMNNGNKHLNIETANLDRDTQCEMLKSQKLQTWAILYQQRDGRLANDFISCLRESIEFCKYPCAPPKTFEIPSNQIQDWIGQIEQLVNMAKSSQNINLLVLVLPGAKKSSPLYDDCKRFLVNNQPIPSQVILTSTISGPKGKLKTVCNKLLVQMCAKTGGTPWGISDMPFSDQPTMICGLDVYHSTSKGKQSFLTFVSTDDCFFSRYITQSIEMSTSGQEFSGNLTQVMINSIKAFLQNNKTLSNIIIFRDGVSASQSKVVTENEVVQFRQAIKLVTEQDNLPKMNLVVISVNKKVGAKFYAGERNFDNPSQGTLVSGTLTTDKDFYLIAQRTLQGTVQPTHYHVLENDLKDRPNTMRDLQILAYKLCYMYYNFSGAIKTPAPIQYAHLCSNFIGDRYDARRPETLMKPHQSFVDRRSLFYI